MDIKKKYNSIDKLIKKSPSIFIMGHKELDLDAIGSALAIYNLAVSKNKKAYIILNDKTHEAGVKKVLDIIKNEVEFITSKKALEKITDKDLLIIVDVNKPKIMQDGDIVSKFSKVIVLDHHDKTDETINSTVELIHPNTSSTSEIIAEFLYYHRYCVPSNYATFLLAGITLDTNDFSVKTTSVTHYAAYFLLNMGASNKLVHVLLKQDIEEYILRQKVITDVEVINKTIAFAKGSNRVIYKKEELAKIADTLLEFNNIETSYVIGRLSDNEIGISARSSGSVNVGSILSLLDGGGDKHEAASRIKDKSIKEVEEKLKQVLGEK